MRNKRKSFLIMAMIFTFIILVTVGCSSKDSTEIEPVNPEVKGFLWEIEKENSTVYLFGSIHVGKEDMYPLSKPVEDAFENSNNLVVECDITNTLNALMAESKMRYEENDNVYNHLTEEGKEKFDSLLNESNLSADYIKNYKLWVSKQLFLNTELRKLGYFSDYGVDKYFLDKAVDNKKILELESLDFQIDLLNSLYDSESEKSSLTDVDMKESANEVDKMFKAYTDGDTTTMIELAMNPLKETPTIYKKMFVDRNVEMAEKIEGYLNTKDTYFVVVGSAHYLGDDSIIKLLEKKGYTVKRMN